MTKELEVIPHSCHEHIQEEREVGGLVLLVELQIHIICTIQLNPLVSQSKHNAKINGWSVTIVHN